MLRRLRLRRAALALAAHDWPVTPGAWLRHDRFDCGRLGCPTASCHPALEGWEQAASQDPTRITAWWRYTPHSLLLPTGVAFDVLEVSAALGRSAVSSPRWHGDLRAPVAMLPNGRWMFLVRTGQPLLSVLASRLDVLRHGRGSWVPAPPTRLVEGPVRWVVPPRRVAWRLPDGLAVQELFTAALTPPVPRARTASAAQRLPQTAQAG